MPLRFTLRQLEYFVAVGEEGSIAAASETLNVSSPSISAAIAQLEAEFGLPLFVRKHARGLSLTPRGSAFVRAITGHPARVGYAGLFGRRDIGQCSGAAKRLGAS